MMKYFFFILLFFSNFAMAEEVFKGQNNEVLQFLPHTLKEIKDYEPRMREEYMIQKDMNNKLRKIEDYKTYIISEYEDEDEELLRKLREIRDYDEFIRSTSKDEAIIKHMLERHKFPLNEFKIGEKYCLFGTKDWDDTCQDAAMKFLYKENWERYKKIALDFLKYAKKRDPERLIELFDTENSIIFWIVQVMEDSLEEIPQYFHISVKKEYPKISEEDLYSLKDAIEHWDPYIKDANYRNFKLEHYPYDPESSSRYTRIFLSKNLFIDIDINYRTKLLRIRAIGYYFTLNKEDSNE